MPTPTTPFYPMTHDDAQGVITALSGIQGDAVRTTEQNLTATQKANARENIGAAESGEVSAIAGKVDDLEEGLAVIAPGNTAPRYIASGKYVYWNGSMWVANGNIAQGATLSSSNLTACPDGGLNKLNDGLTSLNSKITQVLCKKSMAPGASQIPVGDVKKYIVNGLIPSGYVPISVYYEQHQGTSNAHLPCSLFKTSSGDWLAQLYNYYTATLNVNPIITVWSVKEGCYLT
jgi:hypothetical protein